MFHCRYLVIFYFDIVTFNSNFTRGLLFWLLLDSLLELVNESSLALVSFFQSFYFSQ